MMTKMTLSPIQHDYITKTEFNEFRNDVTKQFNSVDKNFSIVHGDIKSMREDFSNLRADFKNIQGDFSNLRADFKNIQGDFSSLREDFKNHTGILIETFRHELKASMEYIDSRLDKKLDKEEFYEYMQLHFPKQSKSRSIAKK